MSRVPVETVLSARDVNTAAVFQKLAGAAEHYNHLLGAGIRAFSTFQALALGGGVLAVGSGLAATAQSLLKVNQELESTTQNLAGSIQVYKYAADYAGALRMADDVLLKIKKDAASLPGTDTDFIRAFAITFPEQAQLGVKTLDEAVKRSNNLTAVLLAKGVDSGQIGRDIGQMLRGHAAMDVRSFAELKGQLGVKDADEFNKKSAKERLKLLDAVIAKNKDVIAAFGTSWDAVSSTAQSTLKSMVLAGSKPLFEEAKRNLKAMNDALEPMLPRIERVLAMVGTASVAAGRGFMGAVAPIASALSPRGLAGSASAEALPRVFDSLATAGQSLLTFLVPLADGLSAVGSALWGGLMAVLPGAAAVFEAVVSIGSYLVGVLGKTAAVIGDALGPVIVDLGKIISWAAGVLRDVLIVTLWMAKPTIDLVIGSFNALVEALGSAYRWISSKFGGAADSDLARDVAAGWRSTIDKARAEIGIGALDASKRVGDWERRYEEQRRRDEQKRANDSYKDQLKAAKLKRPTVHQDFRGSRFNIEQKFAPGFDPGRVLTAVRVDAARLERLRLNAGAVTPLFGGG